MLNNCCECSVQQAICLDENGKWVGRNIYLNMDNTFCKGLQKVLNDRTVKNTYSTNRKVLIC